MSTSANVCEKAPDPVEMSSTCEDGEEDALSGACPVSSTPTSSDNCETPAPEDDRSNDKTIGQRGEDAAAAFLQRQGFEILDRNWRCAYGEADIVASEDEEIVFVEVKTRQGISHGMPEDAVTHEKRDRYEKIAASYLSDHPLSDCYVRFDVIAILVTDDKHGLLRHHRNAFIHED